MIQLEVSVSSWQHPSQPLIPIFNWTYVLIIMKGYLMTGELILIFKLRESSQWKLWWKFTRATDSGIIRNCFGNHNHPLRVANRKLIYKFIGSSWWSRLIIMIMALIWPPVSWDLTLVNDFHIKQMVYANKHNTISELKDEIHEVTHDLPLVQGRNGKWRMSVVPQGVVIWSMPLFVMFNKCQPLINLCSV